MEGDRYQFTVLYSILCDGYKYRLVITETILVTELFFSNCIPYFSRGDFEKFRMLHAIEAWDKLPDLSWSKKI